MIIMPANASGWFWHCLARETGHVGHLISPQHQRGPWPWFPYALDCGTFSLWNQIDNSFAEQAWESIHVHKWRQLLFWAQSSEQKPLWAIVPDRPGDWDETRRKWDLYARELLEIPIAIGVAVQDGASVASVLELDPQPNLVCVGGSTHWKWLTAQEWSAAFPRTHLLRCNSPERLYWLEDWGFESCDGTGWNRGDRTQTAGMEEFVRRNPNPYTGPMTPYVSRKIGTEQLYFA